MGQKSISSLRFPVQIGQPAVTNPLPPCAQTAAHLQSNRRYRNESQFEVPAANFVPIHAPTTFRQPTGPWTIDRCLGRGMHAQRKCHQCPHNQRYPKKGIMRSRCPRRRSITWDGNIEPPSQLKSGSVARIAGLLAKKKQFNSLECVQLSPWLGAIRNGERDDLDHAARGLSRIAWTHPCGEGTKDVANAAEYKGRALRWWRNGEIDPGWPTG